MEPLTASFEEARISLKYFSHEFPDLVDAYQTLPDLDYKTLFEFSEKTKSLSLKVQEAVKIILDSNIPELSLDDSPVSILLTGSDARQERLSLDSPLSIIVVTKEDRDAAPLVSEIKKAFSSYLFQPNVQLVENIEEKCLGRDVLTTFTHSKGEKQIPTRALDAIFLAGSHQLFSEYKKNLFQELAAISFEDFKKQCVKQTGRTLAEIESVDPRKDEIDLETGTLHYDGKTHKALKNSLIRMIQYTFAFTIIQSFKDEPKTIQEIFDRPSLIDRIFYFQEQDKDNTELQSFCQKGIHIYLNCLLQQARVQCLFAKTLQPVSLQIDSKELLATISDVKSFSEKMKEFFSPPKASSVSIKAKAMRKEKTTRKTKSSKKCTDEMCSLPKDESAPMDVDKPRRKPSKEVSLSSFFLRKKK